MKTVQTYHYPHYVGTLAKRTIYSPYTPTNMPPNTQAFVYKAWDPPTTIPRKMEGPWLLFITTL